MGATALTLGIIGLIPYIGWILSPVVSVIAWVLGHIRVKALRASGETKGIGVAMTGKILGIVGTVQAVVFVTAVLLGAMLPAISSAQNHAQTTAIMMTGRNLYQSIEVADMSRQSAGMTTLWPREYSQRSYDRNDIAGKYFSTSTEYFAELLDVKHQGTTDCAPYIDGDLSCVSGGGVPVCHSAKHFSEDNVAWTIAKGLTDDMPENIPVLITRNFPASKLLKSWDGFTDADRKIPLRDCKPLGTKGVVIVYKDGRVKHLKASEVTYRNIYGCSFDTTRYYGSSGVSYLTPDGLE